MQQTLETLADSDFARVKEVSEALHKIFQKSSLIHNHKSAMHHSVVRDASFKDIKTMSMEKRQQLLSSIAENEANPLLAEAAAAVTVGKSFKGDALSAYPAVCLVELAALKSQKRLLIETLTEELEMLEDAEAYVKELENLDEEADRVTNSLNTPLTDDAGSASASKRPRV